MRHSDSVEKVRPYFLIGDIFASVSVGILAGLVSSALVDTGWHMLPAMITCMILGMLLALILALFVFCRYFGAMEVLVPTMFTGMLAGMVVGMVAAMTVVEWPLAVSLGALSGLIILMITYVANIIINGKIVS